MKQRLSDEIDQGLLIKRALIEKIERITVDIIKRLEVYLKYDKLISTDFKNFKSSAHHFIDGGWAGISKAIFILNDGWTLEFTSGRYVYLKNEKLGFRAGSGDWQGGNTFNPPGIFEWQNTVAKLYALDGTLDDLIHNIYTTFEPLQSWIDDLKTRR